MDPLQRLGDGEILSKEVFPSILFVVTVVKDCVFYVCLWIISDNKGVSVIDHVSSFVEESSRNLLFHTIR